MGGASRNVCPVAVEIVMMIAGEHLCTTQRAETNVEFIDCPVKAMRVAGGGTDGLWLGVEGIERGHQRMVDVLRAENQLNVDLLASRDHQHQKEVLRLKRQIESKDSKFQESSSAVEKLLLMGPSKRGVQPRKRTRG